MRHCCDWRVLSSLRSRPPPARLGCAQQRQPMKSRPIVFRFTLPLSLALRGARLLSAVEGSESGLTNQICAFIEATEAVPVHCGARRATRAHCGPSETNAVRRRAVRPLHIDVLYELQTGRSLLGPLFADRSAVPAGTERELLNIAPMRSAFFEMVNCRMHSIYACICPGRTVRRYSFISAFDMLGAFVYRRIIN